MSTQARPSISREWSAGKPAPGWRAILRDEFAKPYMREVVNFLDAERARGALVFPEPRNIFRAYALTDFDDVRVVILGQDPYHGPGQAHGLAFSVQEGVPAPPSLVNIFKEITSEFGTPPPPGGNLERWSRQGVFLLNTALTVRAHSANSHRGIGWEHFTGRTIEALSAREKPIVFLLWGRNAAEHAARIDGRRHLVLKAPHPSPLSAHSGFLGCRHFSQANKFLKENNDEPINW